MFGPSPPFGGLGLVSAIARGRRWLGEIISGAVTDAKQLAKREPCTVRQVNLTLSFAFLAPNWSRQLSKGASQRRLHQALARSQAQIGAGNSKTAASIPPSPHQRRQPRFRIFAAGDNRAQSTAETTLACRGEKSLSLALAKQC
jgi:hypothetical protein